MADPIDGSPVGKAFPWHWVGLIVAAAILIVFRLHAFDLPLETDECNYAYIGARLLEGQHLYVDVWDHQPPGVFVLFAAVIALFGDAPVVFRCLALGFSLASLCLITMILRRACGSRAAAFGAVLFALASSDPSTGGEGCNREIYMNTLILAAWYSAIRAKPSLPSHPRWIALAGVALGIASMLKPIVAVHWLLLAVWLVCNHRSITSILWFVAGPILVWAATFAYFAATHRFAEFFEAVLQANLGYSESGEPFYLRFWRFFRPIRHPFIFQSALPLWIAGTAGLLWITMQALRRRARDYAAVIALALSGYLATCLSGRFWPHYYYLLIPCAVLLACIAIESIRVSLHGRVAKAIAIVLMLALLGWELRYYYLRPTETVTTTRYNYRDFWGRAQGHNVASVTAPKDEVFVFGNEAEIYYYSGRRCASRYTMITGLQVGGADAERRWQNLLDELKTRRPRLILVLFDVPNPPEEWKAFLREFYTEPVGWDFHDRDGQPIMFVVARKDHPIPAIDWNWDREMLTGGN